MSWGAFATGFALDATLIIAIGAQNAYVLRRGLRREHVGAVVLFCAASDLLLIGAGVAGVARLLQGLPALIGILTAAGATFLFGYGARALIRARGLQSLGAQGRSECSSLAAALAQAAGFTFLNPHVYLDTVLLMGAIGARQPPGSRIAFVAGAASASAVWFTALGYGARWLAPLFARPRAWQAFDVLIGLTMLSLSILLVYQGLQGFSR
jgi:L-lysine exporter family protein LysE/ArgO